MDLCCKIAYAQVLSIGARRMMKRREFITLIGGAAAAFPDVVYGQQPVAVIGLLGSSASDDYRLMIAAFQKGLSEAGYVEGRNVSFDHAWADNHYDRLPALASELARRGVNVILAASTPSALAAKAATSTIPIVFAIGGDPVRTGLVASLNRPGGNLTGATNLSVELGPKLLQTLHEFTPMANFVAALINPDNPISEIISRDFQMAARSLGTTSRAKRSRLSFICCGWSPGGTAQVTRSVIACSAMKADSSRTQCATSPTTQVWGMRGPSRAKDTCRPASAKKRV